MEKYQNPDYGKNDPDYIEQNTLIDGTYSNEDQYKQDLKHGQSEFGESDPDYYEQNTPVDNDNYARDEDPYEHMEEFIEDQKDPLIDTNIKAENIPNEERVVNEDDHITNDQSDDLDDDFDQHDDSDLEEQDTDLDNEDNSENLDEADEHFHENHPRE